MQTNFNSQKIKKEIDQTAIASAYDKVNLISKGIFSPRDKKCAPNLSRGNVMRLAFRVDVVRKKGNLKIDFQGENIIHQKGIFVY